VKVTTAWAMPSRWTFQILPVKQFVERWIKDAKVIVDPFCGQSNYATHANDLGRGGVEAEEYCRSLDVDADAVLFDPPYSPRQIAECYKSIGKNVTTEDTQNARLYCKVRKVLWDLLKPNGIALSFGWQSSGFGKKAETLEILLVQHGGAHNDTICVAQRKPRVPCLFD
jgi:hypothetical protein